MSGGNGVPPLELHGGAFSNISKVDSSSTATFFNKRGSLDSPTNKVKVISTQNKMSKEVGRASVGAVVGGTNGP